MTSSAVPPPSDGTTTTHTTRVNLQLDADADSARRVETDCGAAALALDGQLRLTSDDRAFQDSFSGTVRFEMSGQIRFTGSIEVSGLVGTYDASNITHQHHDPRFTITAFLDSGSGSISIEDVAATTVTGGDSTLLSAAVADWSGASLVSVVDAGS